MNTNSCWCQSINQVCAPDGAASFRQLLDAEDKAGNKGCFYESLRLILHYLDWEPAEARIWLATDPCVEFVSLHVKKREKAPQTCLACADAKVQVEARSVFKLVLQKTHTATTEKKIIDKSENLHHDGKPFKNLVGENFALLWRRHAHVDAVW